MEEVSGFAAEHPEARAALCCGRAESQRIARDFEVGPKEVGALKAFSLSPRQIAARAAPSMGGEDRSNGNNRSRESCGHSGPRRCVCHVCDRGAGAEPPLAIAKQGYLFTGGKYHDRRRPPGDERPDVCRVPDPAPARRSPIRS